MTVLPAGGGGRRLPPDVAELKAYREALIELLNVRPLAALHAYQDAVRSTTWPRVRDTLTQIFGETMRYIEAAKTVNAISMAQTLPRIYATARQNDRRRIAATVVDRLVEMGEHGDIEVLQAIGETFPALVVSETVHQQFVCKLAVRLAFRTHSPALAKYVREPLIDALQRALRVGAPAIRDAVVEGLGGLLKFHDHPAERFPYPHRDPTEPAGIAAEYGRRFERHHLMVLAVAGHAESQAGFFAALDAPLGDVLKPGNHPNRVRKIESELRARADLLRTLTAMCRHSTDPAAMTARAIGYLTKPAVPLSLDDDEPEDVHAAVSRFHESVCRTIEVMILRGVEPTVFDAILSNTVAALPRTIAGKPALCNVQARTTVAVLAAATTLVARADDSATERQLAPLFKTLGATGSAWTNPGIVEGCYSVLPTLLSSRFRYVWTEPALEALFASLRKEHSASDVLSTHRQLVANAAFRRLLVTLSDRLLELYLYVDDVNDEGKYARGVENGIRALLREPSAALVLLIFQAKSPAAALRNTAPRGVADVVIGATSFENELLDRSAGLFREWTTLSPRNQLLLTRILGLQLQTSWRDSRGLESNSVLKYVYEDLPTVARSEKERQRRIRELLAALPAEAAGAVDADLQDFVAECGARADERQDHTPHGTELPGYLLAMIDSGASPRIAATVAREIELNLRAARLVNGDFEFAKLLYQVMLRGPDTSIFEHLLPRLDDPTDVRLVELYKKHVLKVRSCPDLPDGKVVFKELRKRLSETLTDLKPWKTPDGKTTLDKLCHALQLYELLAADDHTFWTALIDESAHEGLGFLGELLLILDTIAADTHEEAAYPSHRERLEPRCRDRILQLRSHVAHYIELPVHDFSDRRDALDRAVRVTRQIEAYLTNEAGLQPPEKILLIALLQRFQDVFERTIAWYCEGPRHCIDPEAFWAWYAHEPTSPSHAEKILEQADPSQDRPTLLRTRPSPSERPPAMKNQHRKFQRYFVDWMSSELDIDRLKWALKDRWSWFFKTGYAVITNWWLMVLIILVPSGFAVHFHEKGLHAIEGAGFAAAAVVFLVVALTYLSSWIARVRSRFDAPGAEGLKYRFEAILPRLLKLIVVPLVLIVDFEHSYSFPMNASNAVLLLLMVVAFTSTRFVAERELVLDPAHSRATRAKRPPSARVRQIVSVALAQSFVVSLLFSVIFGSNHVEHIEVPHRFEELSEAAHEAHAEGGIVGFMNRLDIIPDGHARPRLFGILPRETAFDVAALMDSWGWTIEERVAPHVRFVFYPPLILAWTSLGLFFGVFLEGFLKGERLRGEMETEES